MKILITGHQGFIGQNMVAHLQASHDVEVWHYIPNTVPDCSTYDWVVHLGAISSTTETDVELIMQQNLDFSMRLLQICDMQGTNLQYASSASVYGPWKHFVEDAPLLPQSPYAWSKYLFDRFVTLHNDFDILVQGFRYFNVYGPHEDHKLDQASPISKFKKQAQAGEIVLFENSSECKRDFVYVGDVCNIHEQFMSKDVSGIFNLGTGLPTSFESIAKAYEKKYKCNINYIPMPEQLKSQYQYYTCANLDKLKSHIDYKFTDVLDYIKEDLK